MKKILLSFFVLATAGSLCAQSFTETFDLYTADMYVAEQSLLIPWTTWSGSGEGTTEDALVSSAEAFSGANSILLDNAATDLVLDLPDITSGIYQLSMKLFFPAGNGGYFNVLHAFVPGGANADQEWAIDFFFNGDGSATNIAGGTEEPFSYTEGEWVDFSLHINLDDDNAVFKMEGVEVRNWQWSLNGADGAPGLNQFAAIDFYPAGDATSGAPMFYVDDITLAVSTSVNEVAEAVDFTISPNPATDNVTVTLNDLTQVTALTIFDITGKIVHTETVTGVQSTVVDLNNITEGVYMLELLSGNERQTKRLIVSK